MPNGKPHLKSARPVAQLRQGRNDWFRITAKLQAKDEDGGGTFAEVFIYDEIGYFGVTAADFVNELGRVTDDRIMVRLNTPGGDVFDGIAIYNALKEHPATVNVVVDALAASAGSFIAMAGDHIEMTKNASMMIHDASGLAIGNASDMSEFADLLNMQSDNIASIYAERTGGTVQDWRAAMRAETWYSAQEAVAAGLADEVRGASEAKNSWDLSIYAYRGRQDAPEPVIVPATPDDEFDLDSLTEALKGAFA